MRLEVFKSVLPGVGEEATLSHVRGPGGDSDSIGAVYGQIAGAYYGFDAIPERWVKAIKTREKVDSLIENFLEIAGE